MPSVVVVVVVVVVVTWLVGWLTDPTDYITVDA